MNPQILEKLKKILRLANNNANPHEAEVALQKAQQIAIENQIDIASVNVADDQAKERYEKGVVELGQRSSVCQKFVNWIIGKHFNVKIINSGGRIGGKKIHFIGRTSDVIFAQWVNQYLNETFMSCWHNYKNTHDTPTRLRESYIFGLYRGLDAKLEQNKKDVESNKFNQIAQELGEDKSREVQKSYSLTIISEKEQMEQAVAKFFPSLKKGTTKHINLQSITVMEQGFAKGQTINVNRPLGFSGASQLV